LVQPILKVLNAKRQLNVADVVNEQFHKE